MAVVSHIRSLPQEIEEMILTTAARANQEDGVHFTYGLSRELSSLSGTSIGVTRHIRGPLSDDAARWDASRSIRQVCSRWGVWAMCYNFEQLREQCLQTRERWADLPTCRSKYSLYEMIDNPKGVCVPRDPHRSLAKTAALLNAFPNVASCVRRLRFTGFHTAEMDKRMLSMIASCRHLELLAIPFTVLEQATPEEWIGLLNVRTDAAGPLHSLEINSANTSQCPGSREAIGAMDSLKDSRVTFKHLTRLKISGYGSQKNICDTGVLKISETATNLQSLQLAGTPGVPASTVLTLAQASHKTIRLLQYRPQYDSTLGWRSSVLDDQPHLCQQVSALTELRDLDISLVSLCSSIFASDKAQWSGQCIIRFESFCPSTNSANIDRTKSMTKILAAARCLMAERIRCRAELSIELSWGARVFDVRAGTVCYESGRTAEEPAAYRLGEIERDLWLRGSRFSDREKLSRLTVTEDEFLKAMRYDDITSQQSIKAT